MSQLPFSLPTENHTTPKGQAEHGLAGHGHTDFSYTVSQLCGEISAAINDRFQTEVWVQGAISGIKRSAKGHVYFDLVETGSDIAVSTDAVLRVALFAKARSRVNATISKTGNAIRMIDGVEIRVRGAVEFYQRQGSVQLIMSSIDPAHTLGQLATARAQLLAQLASEGLLEANKAQPLTEVPLKIALITSENSAAHEDFTHELELSGYPFLIAVFDARVQGNEAVQSLTSAIRQAGRSDSDVIVMARGGGAKTDLAVFDSEQVARAVAAAPAPIVAGIGHETDQSIVDELAFQSTKTPTAAARYLIDQVARFEQKVEHLSARIADVAHQQVVYAGHDLDAIGHRLSASAQRQLGGELNRLENACFRASATSTRSLERSENELDNAEVRLKALDPSRLLERGWSMTHTQSGDLVRSPAEVSPGSILITTTAAGKIESSVNEDNKDAK